jgi:hypothetical protein
MRESYEDITERLGEPQWWDEHAVPRYCAFAPMVIGNVYAVECCLLLIECQGCRREFRVAISRSRLDSLRRGSLADLVRRKELYYGDPPNTACCAAGAMMNSIPLRVIEFWSGWGPDGRLCERRRVPELEIEIVPAWAQQED